MRAAAIWICCCAYLNCLGWFLSAVHQLNATGYAIGLLVGVALLFIWKKNTPATVLPKRRFPRWRFRKVLPLIFLVVAGLEILGGLIYTPNNYDALTYRLPRLLNWLSAGHWFWIPAINERVNYSTPAWEWTGMPFLAILRSDRGMFLIDVVSFLLMPGLLFSVFRRLKVSRKVAWTWMWILPLAYGYATQAGSVGNDLTGAVLALAAVAFGLRARTSGKAQDIWLCGLAAALMTGTKLSNVPLLLPCLIAVAPALIHLRKQVLGSVAVTVVALVICCAPIVVLNQINTGAWTGDPKNTSQIQTKSPPAAFLGNSLLLAQQSFMPPVLPGVHKFYDKLNDKLPASWQQTLHEKFPRYYSNRPNELPQEEVAGLGLGITALLLLAVATAIACPGKNLPAILTISSTTLVGYAAWISVLFYMLKMGSEATARLMLPYYPLAIVPILLLPAQKWLQQFRAWKILAVGAVLCVIPAIILSPSRPMFPLAALTRFVQNHPQSSTIQRLATVYSTYANRNDSLAPLRTGLPAGVKKVGYLAGSNDTDYSLWRPFGEHQVVYIQDAVKNSTPLPNDVEWLVVKRVTWPEYSKLSLEDWAAQNHAKIVQSVSMVTIVAWGEQTWCLLHVETPGT